MPAQKAPANIRKVTVRDIDLTIDLDVLDDFELLDMLASLEDGNALQAPRILRRVLGEEYADAKKALRDRETGRIKGDVAVEFIRDLFTALDPNS